MESGKGRFSPHWRSIEKSIVQPSAFSSPIDSTMAVLSFSEEIYTCLVNAFGFRGGEPGPRFPGSMQSLTQDSIIICQAYFGSPAAGMLMEALVASGVKDFVMVGQAGAISPRCKIGDLFLPSWGIREEGTSYHYLAEDVLCKTSRTLLSEMKGALYDIGYVAGGVWTTDAPFRETMDKVQRYAGEGAIAVEMECAALMAIAMYREVNFAAALVITDELYEGEWVRGFKKPEVSRTLDRVCSSLAEKFGF